MKHIKIQKQRNWAMEAIPWEKIPSIGHFLMNVDQELQLVHKQLN